METPTADLDRLLAEDFLEGLQDVAMEELRSRKAACADVEGQLSYVRRLVQGRLDIIRAELRRREGGGNGGLADLVDALPEILSEGGRGGSTMGRLPTEMAPGVNHRRLTAQLDRIIDVDRVGLLPGMSDDQVGDLAAALIELEQSVSGQRRAVHERMDAVQAEMVRRYKSGEATVDTLLS